MSSKVWDGIHFRIRRISQNVKLKNSSLFAMQRKKFEFKFKAVRFDFDMGHVLEIVVSDFCRILIFSVSLFPFFIEAHFSCKINWCCRNSIMKSFQHLSNISVCVCLSVLFTIWMQSVFGFSFYEPYGKLCTSIADWDVTVNVINILLFFISQCGVSYDLRSFIFRCLWHNSRLHQSDSIFVIVEQFISNFQQAEGRWWWWGTEHFSAEKAIEREGERKREENIKRKWDQNGM